MPIFYLIWKDQWPSFYLANLWFCPYVSCFCEKKLSSFFVGTTTFFIAVEFYRKIACMLLWPRHRHGVLYLRAKWSVLLALSYVSTIIVWQRILLKLGIRQGDDILSPTHAKSRHKKAHTGPAKYMANSWLYSHFKQANKWVTYD